MRKLSPQFERWLTEKVAAEQGRQMPLLDAALAKIPTLQESDDSFQEVEPLMWLGPRVGIEPMRQTATNADSELRSEELEQHRLRDQRYREHIRAMGSIRFHSAQLLSRLSGLLGSAAAHLLKMPSSKSSRLP